jgi:hypothetical protein
MTFAAQDDTSHTLNHNLIENFVEESFVFRKGI